MIDQGGGIFDAPIISAGFPMGSNHMQQFPGEPVPMGAPFIYAPDISSGGVQFTGPSSGGGGKYVDVQKSSSHGHDETEKSSSVRLLCFCFLTSIFLQFSF